MKMDTQKKSSRFAANSDTTMWNNDGPTVPGIIPFVFFLVLTVTVLLYLYKVLKKYYDKQAKSDTYVFVDHDSDDTARLKKLADDDDIANSPKLNSLKHTSDNRGDGESNRLGGDEVRVEVAKAPEGDLMQVDGASPSAPEGPDFTDNVSGTETLPLNKKKSKPTESNV
ncbi:uncharacterized protein LOC107367878 [Tetranychus urticae]|uniref:Uncharacterized protein n=1 Tax=Tetranychus urticae TaxID=32264 RepID=T1KW67_TETUR|nr:uncharacterized protein LOC107367878 [Tetranychus urticae]